MSNNLIKTNYSRIDKYPDFPSLKATAKAGCGFCHLLRKTIRYAWAARPMEEWGVGPIREQEGLWNDILEESWDGKIKIHKAVFSLAPHSEDSSGNPNTVISLGMEFGPLTTFMPKLGSKQHGDIGRVIGFKTIPSRQTLGLENVNLMTQWIAECKLDHPQCLAGMINWCPSRVLDTGSPSEPPNVRLIETADFPVPYTALSHMWGDVNYYAPLRAFKSNYDDLKTNIPMSNLPRNFKEAVVLTRALGLRYLWIDSLCIIQDDAEDWRREAATMFQVYSAAEVTIVATSATSTHDGFLKRDLSNMAAAKLEYCLEPDSKPSHIVLVAQDDVETGTWYGDVEDSLWNTRGWTMQERRLSSRMLHFSKNKIYFECRTCRRSEENEPIPEYRQFDLWPRSDAAHSAKDKEDAKDRLYRLWIKTVQEYSARKLTKGFDKLTAIYSVAFAMSTGTEGFKDRYIDYAGLWSEYLQHGLLWQVRDGAIEKPKEYRAPSWSWAALDGRLGWNEFKNFAKPSHFHNDFAVLEIGSGKSDENKFLKVKATILPIDLVLECDEDDRWVYGSRSNFPHDLYVRTPSLQLETQLNEISVTTRLGTPRERYDAVEDGQYIKIGEARLDLDDKENLTLSDRQLYYMHVDNLCRPSGLVFESVIKNGETKWLRVGVATVFGKDSELFQEDVWDKQDGMAETCVLHMI
ncbi:hypothetical protein GLAREA_04003 [Glarea lozoyensis ATCC 20868]|uniref:Heterokaryon incompatibility domain-containing protein n=1 Tax=Glarea lozoyensis (strain ATCC 20868 / MF5171) TaxID=1116229 RepID=S3DG93_GLAL2|nr:uncharacterized protein GLAREA_04003 [Glarea lozoyensis ATCC 20868]EPE31036.1 hypothetical protein GLAREA_04003 [Glarea lozoyensis ATCC 20868]